MPQTNPKTGLIQTAWRYPVAIHDRLVALQRERQDEALKTGGNPAAISLNSLITELITTHPVYTRELKTERDQRRVAERRAALAAEQRAARAAQRAKQQGAP